MSPTPTAAPQELVTITQPVTIQIPYGTTVLHRERDFVHTKIRIVQKTTRFLESCASNVFDEVNPGHLLELLAQMIRADVDRLCHLGQRKLLIRMLVDEIPRFPDFYRLSQISVSQGDLREPICAAASSSCHIQPRLGRQRSPPLGNCSPNLVRRKIDPATPDWQTM